MVIIEVKPFVSFKKLIVVKGEMGSFDFFADLEWWRPINGRYLNERKRIAGFGGALCAVRGVTAGGVVAFDRYGVEFGSHFSVCAVFECETSSLHGG